MVWLTCEGETLADKEWLGTVNYTPWQVLKKSFFFFEFFVDYSGFWNLFHPGISWLLLPLPQPGPLPLTNRFAFSFFIKIKVFHLQCGFSSGESPPVFLFRSGMRLVTLNNWATYHRFQPGADQVWILLHWIIEQHIIEFKQVQDVGQEHPSL